MFLYYPASEDQIAFRLLEKFSDIKHFLEQYGLVLTFPLHVILDNKLDRPAVEVKMIVKFVSPCGHRAFWKMAIWKPTPGSISFLKDYVSRVSTASAPVYTVWPIKFLGI